MEKTKKKEEKVICNDRLCPTHGDKKLKLRGRAFEGRVIKKQFRRLTIQFERMRKVPKYERFERITTKLHARLPDCMAPEIQIGDLVQIRETRPISKTIHFIVTKVIKKADEK